MTTGYICDRCGETFTGGGKWLQGGYHGSTAIMHRWDLCPDCMEGFAGWMERGLMAEAPEESANCVSSNDGERATADREHSLESESVREQPDSREKLEADVRKHYAYSATTLMCPPSANKTTDMLGALPVDTVIGWLDRQAAITERECMECSTSERVGFDCAECAEGLGRELDARCDPLKARIAELCDQVDELTMERDNLRIYRDTWEHTAHLHEKDIERLVEERDQWKDAYEDSERMRLELVDQVEYHEALIARLKQRRGELMEQVRKLQDDAARARREA